jgi:sugar/nucleoside kinase (ribokinase family)
MSKICYGAGLVALDAVMNGNPMAKSKLFAGGSCGNVLTILSYLSWKSHPIAQLGQNKATEYLIHDLTDFGVKTNMINSSSEGRTPIIIQRMIKKKTGQYGHKFEFRDPNNGERFPKYKPLTEPSLEPLLRNKSIPDVFYFDRLNTSTVALAKHFFQNEKTLIFFEPSSIKRFALFKEVMPFVHVIKFSDERIPNYAKTFSKQLCPLEIETRGEQGAAYRFSHKLKASKWTIVKGFYLDNIADTVGAGDWCTAGIISQLATNGYTSFTKSDSISIQNAIIYGQALGAINCLFTSARGLMYHSTAKRTINTAIKLIENPQISLKKFVDSSTQPIYKEINIAELSSLYL